MKNNDEVAEKIPSQGILSMECECGGSIILPVARISVNPFAKWKCPNSFYGKCDKVWTSREIQGRGEVLFNKNTF